MKLYEFLNEDIESKAKLIEKRFKISSMGAFHLAKEMSSLSGLDIYKYSTKEELMKAIEDAQEKRRHTKTQKKKAGKQLIFSNNKAKVYRINTAEAAESYGSRASWCLTNPNDWNSIGEDDSWYFIETKYTNFSKSFINKCFDKFDSKRQEDDWGWKLYIEDNPTATKESYIKKYYNLFAIGQTGDGKLYPPYDAMNVAWRGMTDEFLRQLNIPKSIFVYEYRDERNETL